MDVVGPSRPTELATSLPRALASLVASHGAGVLMGVLHLAPPGCREHAHLHARFEAERARRAPGMDWMALRSARGDRVCVVGESLGVSALGFVLFDPDARVDAGLFAACGDGRVLSIGGDLEALCGALARGVPAVGAAPRWLSEALARDPALLDLPDTYDTRDDDDVRAWADALARDDEAAVEAAFARFASARSLPRRLIEGRAVLASVSGTCARDIAKHLDRIAARQPVALRLGELALTTTPPVLASLVSLGFAATGSLDERLALALDGEPPIDVARLEEALVELPALGVSAASSIRTALAPVPALHALAWLVAVRHGRVGGKPLDGVEPIELAWLPDLGVCWPVLVLALLECTSYVWASPHLVTLLDRANPPGLRAMLVALATARPRAFANGGAELAADAVLARGAPTSDEADALIASVRARSPRPRRYQQPDADAAPALAILVRSAALPSVAAFFAADVTRAPYAAYEAARRTSVSAGRDILHAIFTGAVPVELCLSACELAAERGDARATAKLDALRKSVAIAGRRLDRM